jgi:hypothetical protein
MKGAGDFWQGEREAAAKPEVVAEDGVGALRQGSPARVSFIG